MFEGSYAKVFVIKVKLKYHMRLKVRNFVLLIFARVSIRMRAA
jgi:hypothetical protein